jgi:hypothetical protein
LAVHLPRGALRAQEDCQHTDQFLAEEQRLAGESLDAFPLGPVGVGDPLGIADLDVVDLQGLSLGGHVADLAHADRKATVVALGTCPFQFGFGHRLPGTGGQVQARHVAGAFVPARATNHHVHQRLARVLLRHGQQELLQGLRIRLQFDHPPVLPRNIVI